LQMVEDFKCSPPLKYRTKGKAITATNALKKTPVNAAITKTTKTMIIKLISAFNAYRKTTIEDESGLFLFMEAAKLSENLSTLNKCHSPFLFSP
jgi:hypothetical protein